MKSGDGPIALILSPTRELASQIFSEAKRFAKMFNIRVCAIFGGGGKYEMQKALKEEVPEVVVATPGRLIDLILSKATNLKRCTFVVLDEVIYSFYFCLIDLLVFNIYL
jgi:ATP-dependent RNA helicase DDX42